MPVALLLMINSVIKPMHGIRCQQAADDAHRGRIDVGRQQEHEHRAGQADQSKPRLSRRERSAAVTDGAISTEATPPRIWTSRTAIRSLVASDVVQLAQAAGANANGAGIGSRRLKRILGATGFERHRPILPVRSR